MPKKKKTGTVSPSPPKAKPKPKPEPEVRLHDCLSLPDLSGYDLQYASDMRAAAMHLRSCADSFDEVADLMSRNLKSIPTEARKTKDAAAKKRKAAERKRYAAHVKAVAEARA